MTKDDIDRFFANHDLEAKVQKQSFHPEMWLVSVGEMPVLIQSQESVNRMRIVAFIAETADVDRDEMTRLLQANYHSALDARYALTDDGQLVSVFLHPLRELNVEQFVLGFCQVINCAETYGSQYSGGTLQFRRHSVAKTNGDEYLPIASLDELVNYIKNK